MRYLLYPLPALLVLLIYLWQWGVLRDAQLQLLLPQWWWMATFFWAVYRPSFWPISWQLGIGLLIDLWVHTPLGLTPLLTLIAMFVLQGRRRALLDMNLPLLWMNFSIWFGCVWMLLWSVGGVYLNRQPDMWWVAMQALSTLLCYPLWHGFSKRFLAALERAGV